MEDMNRHLRSKVLEYSDKVVAISMRETPTASKIISTTYAGAASTNKKNAIY
jgi:hypothetical protein